MKGLYVTTVGGSGEKDLNLDNGVNRKIYAQIRTLQKNEIEVKVYNTFATAHFLLRKIAKYSPVPVPLSKYDLQIFDYIKNCDFVYVRNPVTMDSLTGTFLREIKSINKNISILLEIPTFPYKKEFRNSLKTLFLNRIDSTWRNRLINTFDVVLTYSQDKEIWNIPAINISNAVLINEFRRKDLLKEIKNNTIEIIACAQHKLWHGYDRALRGLADFYKSPIDKKYKLILHIVGNGPPLEEYRRIVSDNGLDNYVVFHGNLKKTELERVYDRCLIGLDSMGRHRAGVFYNSSLKGKEYMAKGLIVISGVRTELDFRDDFKYYFRVPADEQNVDFFGVINFVENLLKKERVYEIQNNIIEYAEKNFDYNSAMKPVIDYIKQIK